jgi:hypothetical protein
MRWLVYGKLAAAVSDALVRHEQSVAKIDIAPDASPADALAAAQNAQVELITNDAGVVDAIYEQRVPFNRCVVYLQLEGGDVEQDDAIDRLFVRYKRFSAGRMYTVTGSRVKIRQLPGS